MDAPQDTIGRELLDAVQKALGEGWTNLSENDRNVIAQCASDAAALQIQSLAATTQPIQDRLVREKQFVAAALKNIAAIEGKAAQDAFWATFDVVAARGLKVLGLVATAAI